MDPIRLAEQQIARARRRLRLRGLVRGGSLGLHGAGWLAVLVVVVGRLAGLPIPWVAAAALVAALGAVAVGAAAGALRSVPDERGLALLVDRLGGTEELVLTALHVAGTDDPNRDAILGRLADARLPDPAGLLPVIVPRHARWAALPVLTAAVALALVRPLGGLPWSSPASPVAEEGRRLEERLKALEAEPGAELPAPIEREVARLAEELKGDELAPDEARERLSELQQRLDQLREELAPSADLLDDLEQAAEQLDAEATEQLQQALQDGDLESAAEAASDLSRSLSEASPEERQRAAESLQRAGEELARSSDPALQGAGQALQQAADQVGGGQAGAGGAGGAEGGRPGTDPGEAGSDGRQAGSDGSGAGSQGGGLSPEQAAELARQLAQARELGEQLQRDREALRRSQELAGALEGSRQRLGGDPNVAGGESSQSDPGQGGQGQGGQGQQAGEGQGAGEAGSGNGPPGSGGGDGASRGASGAGTGHTWEDQGELAGAAAGAEEEDRTSDRKGGQHIDDFQKLYAGQRLDGAQSLVAGVEGQVDPDGKVDQLPIRLTEGDEDARVPVIEVPATYRDEAAEAIEAEQVPPAYREVVKEYFDGMR